jgi:hypothetical protein
MALNYPSVDNAIAGFEGFGTVGTIAQRQNNPGNVSCGSFAGSYGGICGTNNIANFPTLDQGTAAEDALVSQYANKGATLASMLQQWAPPNAPGNTPQSTANYINYVSSQLGVDPSTPVTSLAATSIQGGVSEGPAASSISSPNWWSLALDSILSGGSTSGVGAAAAAGNAVGSAGLGTAKCDLAAVLTGTVGGQGPIGSGTSAVSQAALQACMASAAPTGLFAGFSWGRVLAVVIGVAFVGGGLMLWKPVQETVVSGAKAAIA